MTTGGTLDPSTGYLVGATTQVETAGPINAFIYVEQAKSVLRDFVEILEGDIIIDLPPTAPIDGYDNLFFIINNFRYQQAKMSGRLTQMWDTIIAGNTTVRTLLLRLAT